MISSSTQTSMKKSEGGDACCANQCSAWMRKPVHDLNWGYSTLLVLMKTRKASRKRHKVLLAEGNAPLPSASVLPTWTCSAGGCAQVPN